MENDVMNPAHLRMPSQVPYVEALDEGILVEHLGESGTRLDVALARADPTKNVDCPDGTRGAGVDEHPSAD
jgi:hypothetical protein